jgi:hypothetical protein
VSDPQLAAAVEALTGQCGRALRAVLERDDAAGVLAGLLAGELVLVVARDQVSIVAAAELPASAGISHVN